MFSSIGNTLFSYYQKEQYDRKSTYENYLEIYEKYQGIGNYFYPYSYVFNYTNSSYEVPLYNSQLKYYDDCVPLLQVVLKGNIEMFSTALNYNSLGKETILNLIDYGINPAYFLNSEGV